MNQLVFAFLWVLVASLAFDWAGRSGQDGWTFVRFVDSAEITSLPGLHAKLDFKQYSGYVQVSGFYSLYMLYRIKR